MKSGKSYLTHSVASPPSSTWRRLIRTFGWASIATGMFLIGLVAQQLFVTTWFSQQNQADLASRASLRFESVQVTTREYTSPQSTQGAPDAPSDASVAPATPRPPTAFGSTTYGSVATSTPTISRTLLVEPPPEPGAPFAIITIPSLARLRDGWVVVEGVTVADLHNGAGHIPRTSLPGQPGNAVISGHRM